MKIPLSMSKQTRPLLRIPTNGLGAHLLHRRQQKDKVVVVMGATGTGKSRLSIDLATRFAAEVINSDKMQVYRGLDIATNKITAEECRGIPHHLLGVVDPESDFSAANFLDRASSAMKSILRRDQLPIIVGGSNSFIEALVDTNFRSKYDCCFLWVDVEMPVLHSFIFDRVDRMVERGMVNEVRDFFNPKAEYSRGIRRAIGVPEFDNFFRNESFTDGKTRAKLLTEAIDAVKMNTSKLARRQLEKIHRLRNLKGWELHRLDATTFFKKPRGEAEEAWNNLVAGQSATIVNRFLHDYRPVAYGGVMGIQSSLVAAASQ